MLLKFKKLESISLFNALFKMFVIFDFNYVLLGLKIRITSCRFNEATYCKMFFGPV